MTTYAGLYGPEALIDSSGHAITSAVIDVFTHGTTTHVSLYQDNARGTPLSNPVPNGVDGSTAGRGLDTFGNLSFYVDPGRYDLRIATGAGTRTVEIEVETDPAENAASSARQTLAVYSPLDPYFGAIAHPDDLTTDSLAAIQARIDAAYNDGGGLVPVPAAFLIDGSVVLKAHVQLAGIGWGVSKLRLADGANSHMLIIADHAMKVGASRLELDGNKEHQTSTTIDGVYFNNVTNNTDYFAEGNLPGVESGTYFFEHILVGYCKRHGLNAATGSESRYDHIYAFRCDVNGINANGSDGFFSNLTAGECGQSGIVIDGAGHRVTSSKSWYSGRMAARGTFWSAGAGNNYPGFTIRGENHELTALEAQDNGGDGFDMAGDSIIGNGLNADANYGYGYTIGVSMTNCEINGRIGNGTSHGITSLAAVRFLSPGTGNRVRIAWSPNACAAVASGVAGSIGNKIVVGTPDAHKVLGWASTITPDPAVGGPLFTLAGNTTIANPAADRYLDGTEFEVTAVQDATGSRTVTWGADYIISTAVTATATQATIWRLRCINGKWVEVAGRAALAGITVPTVAPSQVTGLSGTPANASVGLSWAAPFNGGSAITDYVVQYRTTAGPGSWTTFADGTSTATSATVTGLTNGTSYDFQVAAVNSVGQGAYSAAATATPILVTTYVNETFAGSGALAGSTDTTGKTWAGDAGFIRSGGVLTATSTFIADTINAGVSDCVMRCTVTNPSGWILNGRRTDGNNQMTFAINGMSATVGGSAVGSMPSWTSLVAGDVMKVVFAGGTVTIYKNESTLLGTTSAAGLAGIQNVTNFGVTCGGSTSAQWDDFTIKSA